MTFGIGRASQLTHLNREKSPMKMVSKQSPVDQSQRATSTHFIQSASPHHLSHELIASLAYELFTRRGSVHGHDQQDWALAEKELRSPSPRRSLGA
jgi:hypothetical protein